MALSWRGGWAIGGSIVFGHGRVVPGLWLDPTQRKSQAKTTARSARLGAASRPGRRYRERHGFPPRGARATLRPFRVTLSARARWGARLVRAARTVVRASSRQASHLPGSVHRAVKTYNPIQNGPSLRLLPAVPLDSTPRREIGAPPAGVFGVGCDQAVNPWVRTKLLAVVVVVAETEQSFRCPAEARGGPKLRSGLTRPLGDSPAIGGPPLRGDQKAREMSPHPRTAMRSSSISYTTSRERGTILVVLIVPRMGFALA
jgi:hypothetical protein